MSSCSDQYEILCEFIADGIIPITKYVSKTTGMKIYNCKVDGPRVVCHLTLATDPWGNDGLPYAVQHLVGMGSESHPHPGTLKFLTEDCDTLACSIEASISTDYSSYKISAIGATGVLNLLPVCLEHILYPAFTEHSFLTEIHHVNGDGEDAGTMCCERMTYENGSLSLCLQALYQAVFPEESHYDFKVKGLAKNIRENITNAKIKEYHKSFYRPDNLSIIIAGDVEANDIFQSISPIIEKIAQKGVLEKLSTPWRYSVSPLSTSKEQVIIYPSDYSDEKGMVYVSWRGPSIHQIEDCTGLELLLQYLSDNSSSPLRQAFVTVVDPYCDCFESLVKEAAEICAYICFQNVLKAKQFDVKNRLLELLNDINNGKQEFDMKKMSDIIHKTKTDILTQLEDLNPHDTLCSLLTTDFLYGQTASHLEGRMSQIHILDSLADKDVAFWRQLLKKYLLNENIVVIIGEPCLQLNETLSEEENKRIAKQKEDLGEEGLKQKEYELQEAREKNKAVVENELLTSVLLPSPDSIKFHQLVQSCNYEDESLYDSRLKSVPCGFQLDNITTKFIHIWVLMDTGGLSVDLRLYLPLFLDVLVRSVIAKSKSLDVKAETLAQNTNDILDISVEISSDNCNSFRTGIYDEIAIIKLKVEENKHKTAIKWLHEILYEREFTQLLIQECISNMIQRLSLYKGLNEATSFLLSRIFIAGQRSNMWCGNNSQQYNFLKKLLEANLEGVAENLEKVRSTLTDPNSIVIHMAANIEKLGQNSLSVWENLSDLPNKGKFCRHTIQKDRSRLHQLESSSAKSYIVDAGDDATCTLYQLGKGVEWWNDPDFPAMHVLSFYFLQQQGRLWSLMESIAISQVILTFPFEGFVSLYVAAKEDLVSTYKELKGYICNLLNNDAEWDKNLIERACSGAITNIILEKEGTVLDVSMMSLLSYYNGINKEYTRHLVEEMRKVTSEDLKRVGTKYILPLLDPAKSACFISSSTSAVQSIVSGFKELSRELHVVTDDSILSDI